MEKLIQRLAGLVKGCITGFDRIVFKGFIMPLMYAKGAMNFCKTKGILNKNYKEWMLEQSQNLIDTAEQYSVNTCGHKIIPLSTWRIRKEEAARNHQKKEQIEKGLIGIWSCLESGLSYRARYCAKTGYPQLQNYQTQCKHLYFYFVHEEFGFMNIRLQTWFPYHIQICLNGREWLRRYLENQGIGFWAEGNKFFDISDYENAQFFLNSQIDTRWPDMLNGFIPTVFPLMKEILGPNLSYYWTMWQSEWATDFIFGSPDELNPIRDTLLYHALISGTGTRILRYMDRPLKKDGKPTLLLKDEVNTRMMDFNDGVRVRHWDNNNSVKVYNEKNVLRVEMTMNNPGMFRVFRHKQGQSPEEEKKRLPLRKSVADIPLRARVSQEINERFMINLASFSDNTPACELFKDITHSRIENGRRIRALDPTGKDRELLQLLSDPVFRVSGVSNKSLQQKLTGKFWAAGRTSKQLSARISRHLRLLRDHGIIKKLPNQNKYQMTIKGVKVTNVLNVFWASSTEKLMKMAA